MIQLFRCRLPFHSKQIALWYYCMSVRKIITCNLFDAVSVHVEQYAAIDDATSQLKQAVEGKCCDIGLAPPLPTVLHIFLKLQPPAR